MTHTTRPRTRRQAVRKPKRGKIQEWVLQYLLDYQSRHQPTWMSSDVITRGLKEHKIAACQVEKALQRLAQSGVVIRVSMGPSDNRQTWVPTGETAVEKTKLYIFVDPNPAGCCTGVPRALNAWNSGWGKALSMMRERIFAELSNPEHPFHACPAELRLTVWISEMFLWVAEDYSKVDKDINYICAALMWTAGRGSNRDNVDIWQRTPEQVQGMVQEVKDALRPKPDYLADQRWLQGLDDKGNAIVPLVPAEVTVKPSWDTTAARKRGASIFASLQAEDHCQPYQRSKPGAKSPTVWNPNWSAPAFQDEDGRDPIPDDAQDEELFDEEYGL